MSLYYIDRRSVNKNLPFSRIHLPKAGSIKPSAAENSLQVVYPKPPIGCIKIIFPNALLGEYGSFLLLLIVEIILRLTNGVKIEKLSDEAQETIKWCNDFIKRIDKEE